ncbi:GTP-binding SAR1 protein [Rutstroemia sp. NJR-2017a BVV2]|nr:GTP-binding SAR1 protein [Rutstroemia sp. NJR-2017a BVV2]
MVFAAWSAQAISTPNMPTAGEEELVADVDEPPDLQTEFTKATFRPQNDRSESLLTRALKSPESDTHTPEIHITTDLTRRRSMMSTASMASTAELTSDGGFTSPARTNTPSPPIPNTYTSFAPFSISRKSTYPPLTSAAHIEAAEPVIADHREALNVSPKATIVTLEPAPRKRCISFACGARKDPVAKPAPAPATIETASPKPEIAAPTPKRACTIKFACPMKPTEKKIEKAVEESPENPEQAKQSPKLTVPSTPPVRRRVTSRSPSTSRKPRPAQTHAARPHRDSTSTVRNDSKSPVAIRVKPKYIIADEATLHKSEATRFHEFASEVPEEDDWISRDEAEPKARLTINDTLQKENAIRRLGTASASSIDTLDNVGHLRQAAKERRKKKKTRAIKIRPGTPDLPDSTDFVCGTLDEDRPLEDAYVSCVKAREYAKHIATPQDIDPSFPTSDPEDEEDEVDEVAKTHDSDDHVWLHGKFEDSDSERRRRSRRSPGQSPRRLHSPPPPKRYHSPPPKQRLHSPPPKRYHSPPPKQRLRSPPPRKLFGNQSPKRNHSPPPLAIESPPASPAAASRPIAFAPLGSRPGLTHTKSLPRTPNAFCRQYAANRAAAANGNLVEDGGDGHVRGAIDIVKGLEQKRQRRKEKFYQKHCARARKPNAERRPQPGKGAERMRELGLLMAGKTGTNDAYMLSA